MLPRRRAYRSCGPPAQGRESPGELGAEGDDQEVAAKDAPVHQHLAPLGVNPLDSPRTTSTPFFSRRASGREIVRGAAARHEPEQRRREDEGGLALHQDYPMLRREGFAQSVGRHQPADTSPQDQNRHVGACLRRR
jgi:hypothetical protein